MIQMKAGDLLGAKDILSRLANTEMSAKDCFKVLRILKAIDAEYNSIIESQKKTLEKYAEYDESGKMQVNDKGGIVLRQQDSEQCVAEMNELYSTIISLPCEKIEVGLLENLSFTPSQLLAIEGLIEYGN